jgi:multiple antibiotic resistance protein
MVIVYLVLKYLYIVKKILGESGSYILRKFFGVVLMAIAVKLLTSNMSALINSINAAG